MSKKNEKQKRSILTEDKILNTAKDLFSEKGFYNVSTNEIAKIANLSIGTLYHHFSDKNEILSRLLERHNEYFKTIFEADSLTSKNSIKELKENPRKWLKHLIEVLISMHENDLAFIKELDALYYNHPDVKKQKDEHTKAFQKQTYDVFMYYQDEICIDDLEAFSTVIYGFITSIVDQIVLFPSSIGRERLLNVGLDILVETVQRLFQKEN